MSKISYLSFHLKKLEKYKPKSEVQGSDKKFKWMK